MAFFSKNLYYIKFFSDMYYHVFSTKADQEGGSIHEKKNLYPEIHILVSRHNSPVHLLSGPLTKFPLNPDL